jgi:hypothetical protein
MYWKAGLCKLQKGCTRLAAANAKAYQLLVHGRWFSQGTPASCTSKKGCHDLAPPILIGIKCVLYEVCVYAGDACITVDLHESDKRNVLLGPLLIDN